MTPDLTTQHVYTDFSELANLRGDAQRDPRAALADVSRQFESLFMQMMLKSMRATAGGDAMLGGGDVGFYQDMLDKQLSVEMSEGGGIGLAKMLVRHLGGTLPEASAPASEPRAWDQGRRYAGKGVDPASILQPAATPFPGGTPSAPTEAETPSRAKRALFESPAAFIDTLRPHARRAAARLGVEPRALLAQAALETGWGRGIIDLPDGRSSHNLFGIKAGAGWRGERVNAPTIEFESGAMRPVRAAFRAYGSPAESFDDYANFISGQPRYQAALAAAGDAHAYLRELQAAGYATDPRYAEKIMALMNRIPAAGPELASGSTPREGR